MDRKCGLRQRLNGMMENATEQVKGCCNQDHEPAMEAILGEVDIKSDHAGT